MLSAENPPDPSCSSCKISGLKSDERASDKLVLKEADPSKSGLEDAQLPNFSIRNYVFSIRGKDIQTSWPFPQQYLQLCLKHGVKDLLPPFEPPDLIRNRCFRKGVEFSRLLSPVCGSSQAGSLEKDNCRYFDGVSSSSSDQSVLGFHAEAGYSSEKQDNISVDPENSRFCRSPCLDPARVEAEFPSSVVNHAQSEGESVPTDELPYSSQDACTLSGALLETEAAAPPRASHKTDNTIQPSGRKCKLIVKLSTTSDPSRTEDIQSNTTTLSEPMASKVCPVCKTFSSTSNTTLNAHIDQCLSVESISKENSISQLTKHRVKPRKKRSMIDICATAPRCTLEELDKRNGSNWARDFRESTNRVDLSADGKRQRVLPVAIDDIVDNSAVYIDSNGTKLRILSKFNDASIPTVGEDPKTMKRMKGSKERNIPSTNKKNHLALKHAKCTKLKPQCKKFRSIKPYREEIDEAQKGNYGMEDNCEREESLSKIFKPHEQTRPRASGTLRQWVCSRRNELSEVNGEDNHQSRGNPSPVMQDPLTKDDQSCLGDSCLAGSHIQNSWNSTESSISSAKRKKLGGTLWEDGITGNVEKPSKLPARNLNQSREITSLSDTCMLKLSKSSGSHASSLRRKRVEIHAGSVDNPDGFPKVPKNPSKGRRPLSKEKKLSTVRKKMLLIASSSPKSKLDGKKISSASKKSCLHSISGLGEQTGAMPSGVDELCDKMFYVSRNQSECINRIEGTKKFDFSKHIFEPQAEETLGRTTALESCQEGEDVNLEREDSANFEVSRSGRRLCGLDHAATVLSSAADSIILIDRSRNLESAVREVPLGKATGGHILRSNANLVLEHHKLPLVTKPNSLLSIEEHKGSLCRTKSLIQPIGQSSLDDEGIFCTDEVDDNIIGQDNCSSAEVDCNLGCRNSFSEVATIPIPGPPGSFLPSPRDMGSEVLQENSSLTSSRILSPQDQHMLADRESTGSPVSATSTISHLPSSKSDLNYSEPELLAELPSAQDTMRSSFPDASFKSLIGGTAAISCRTNIEAEKINLSWENQKLAKTSPAKRPEKFSNDQPCCCSKKGMSQGVAYEETLLFKPHGDASVRLPAKGKLIGCNDNVKPEIFTSSGSCPCLRVNKVLLPVLKLPPVKDYLDPPMKFASHVDYDHATPSSQSHHPQSSSSPVLRLMGKNLMVVNKEEDASMQLRSAQPGALCAHLNLHCSTLHGLPSGNNQDHHLHHPASESCVISGLDPPMESVQCFDVRFSDNSRSVCQSKSHIAATQPGSNHRDVHIGGFAAASLHQRRSEDIMSFQTQRHLDSRRNDSYAYNRDYIVATAQLQRETVMSTNQAAGNPIQEVIVVDKSDENEADSSTKNSKYIHGSTRSHLYPSQSASKSNLRHVNAVLCPATNTSYSTEPPGGTSPSSFMPSQGGEVGHVRWGGASQGSHVLFRSPFVVSSTSTGQRSPAMYYSPSSS